MTRSGWKNEDPSANCRWGLLPWLPAFISLVCREADGYGLPMKLQEVERIVDRELFRPFVIRLTNGAKYHFKTRRDLGASKDCQMLFYFSDAGDNVRIDANSIVEIFEK